MALNGALLAKQVTVLAFENYVRVIRTEYASSPLGCAPGVSRFGGTSGKFAVLYAARDLATALAETVVRDRFEGLGDRRLFVAELAGRSAVELSTTTPLRLLDLRQGGCLKIGVSTDVTGAKGFDEAQALADQVHPDPTIDGILYPSRLTGGNCVAVFDQVIPTHLHAGMIAPLSQLETVGAALNSLNVLLIG
ncbi:MAG TPA: RES family NAD+ phosphorylase [Sphingomicrobium sp.]|nr:RES family NAD+ phosphorylase [Sphingomicrobium sp.]